MSFEQSVSDACEKVKTCLLANDVITDEHRKELRFLLRMLARVGGIPVTGED